MILSIAWQTEAVKLSVVAGVSHSDGMRLIPCAMILHVGIREKVIGLQLLSYLSHLSHAVVGCNIGTQVGQSC